MRREELCALVTFSDVDLYFFDVLWPPIVYSDPPLAPVDAMVGLLDLADDRLPCWLWNNDSFLIVDCEARRVNG